MTLTSGDFQADVDPIVAAGCRCFVSLLSNRDCNKEIDEAAGSRHTDGARE